MTKKLSTLALVFAVVLPACADDQSTTRITSETTGAFQRTQRSTVGPVTSVAPPLIVLKLACCDGDYCIWVDTYSQCSSQAFYCNVGQTNLDGTVTCYD